VALCVCASLQLGAFGADVGTKEVGVKDKDGPGVEQEFEVANEPPEDEKGDAAKAGLKSALKEGVIEDWDKHMEGFVPELMLTFPLPPRTDEFFYEDMPGGDPVLIRGGFFASASEEDSSVDFLVTDPKGNVAYEKNSAAEGLFHFIAAEKGTYTFVLSNHKWMQEKTITFVVGKGNQTHLQPEHLNTIEEQVKAIDKTLVDIQTESTYLWIRQKSHMKTVESIHTRVLAFCVVEFLILVGISGFQVYYIKGLLSDRRIL
jgi:hypothetical protein